MTSQDVLEVRLHPGFRRLRMVLLVRFLRVFGAKTPIHVNSGLTEFGIKKYN